MHFFALLLWAASGLALLGGMPQLAVAIAGVVVLNGVFAFVQPSGGVVAVQAAGRILRWDLDPKRWAAQACSVANRQLTDSEWRAFLPDRPYAPSCGP